MHLNPHIHTFNVKICLKGATQESFNHRKFRQNRSGVCLLVLDCLLGAACWFLVFFVFLKRFRITTVTFRVKVHNWQSLPHAKFCKMKSFKGIYSFGQIYTKNFPDFEDFVGSKPTLLFAKAITVKFDGRVRSRDSLPISNCRGVVVFYADADHRHSNHVCHCHYMFNHRATGHHSVPDRYRAGAGLVYTSRRSMRMSTSAGSLPVSTVFSFRIRCALLQETQMNNRRL